MTRLIVLVSLLASTAFGQLLKPGSGGGGSSAPDLSGEPFLTTEASAELGAETVSAIWHPPTAYASLPTCDSSIPSDYFPLTDSHYDYVYCDGSAPYRAFISGVEVEIPPAASSWTVVNGASGTAVDSDDGVGGVTLSTSSGVLGFEATLRAVPAAPFKKSMLVSWFNSTAASVTDGWLCGVMFSTGTATTDDPQSIDFISQDAEDIGIAIQHDADFSRSSTTTDAYRAETGGYGSRAWLQLEDDNTTKYFRICPAGPHGTCQTLFSVARATNGTPTHYGFHCARYGGSATTPWQITLIGEVTQ